VSHNASNDSCILYFSIAVTFADISPGKTWTKEKDKNMLILCIRNSAGNNFSSAALTRVAFLVPRRLHKNKNLMSNFYEFTADVVKKGRNRQH